MLKLGAIVILTFVLGTRSQFQWQTKDPFDEIRVKMAKITADNCNIKHRNELFLDQSDVSHLPDIKEIDVNPVLPNRTALLQVHNMALGRAIFFSFILQKAWDDREPGFMYYYLSTIADVAANSKLNASAIYFSPNMSYTPSYKGFFNKTMPLFAPRTFRADDFNDPIHLQRTSTLNTFESADLGAFRRETQSLNYTIDAYRINHWYNAWLPDDTKRQDSKSTYTVLISYANGTNDSFVWHGPPGAEEKPGPVRWTRPYFDCGRSNKWVIGATVPIPDVYPRHTQFRHIEIPTYVAVAVMEMDYDRVDINQCPLGQGNPAPNKFAGTDRCNHKTTECEPLHGYGFRRGGYQCRCKPGFRLPNNVWQPYLGEIIERATSTEYNRLFDCKPIEYQMLMPQHKLHLDNNARGMYMNEFSRKPQEYNPKPAHAEKVDLKTFFHYIRSGLNKTTCHNRKLFSASELELHGDVSYGVESQFENEARTALRLATFISGFLQVVDPNEQYGEFRLADKPLTEDQMFGEVISMVVSNVRIWGAGAYWEKNKFPNRTHFAPYAYQKNENVRNLYAEDLAKRTGEDYYMKKKWFKHLKSRWATDMDSLEQYNLKIRIRANQDGDYGTKYDHYPIRFRGPNLSHGYWTNPYFDCGNLNLWVVTYAAPFFGFDSIRNKLEFKGVVAVTSWIDKLDINQCSDHSLVTNAFKDTHKCDKKTSYCIPILGRGFDSGGYKCECKQGFEYPFKNPITYYDGQLMEAEYDNLVEFKESWFDMLKCRIAFANNVTGSLLLIVLMLTIYFNLQ